MQSALVSPCQQFAKAVYSIVTASRAISLATSSRCAESWASTSRASRIRHSSSLMAGMSLGTIEGTGLTRVWMSGIESSPGGTRRDGNSAENESFSRSVARARDRRIAWRLAKTPIARGPKRLANHCDPGGFAAASMPRERWIFGPLQALTALLYAARRDPLWGFVY